MLKECNIVSETKNTEEAKLLGQVSSVNTLRSQSTESEKKILD